MSLLIKSRAKVVRIYLECEYIEEILEMELPQKFEDERFKIPPIF